MATRLLRWVIRKLRDSAGAMSCCRGRRLDDGVIDDEFILASGVISIAIEASGK